jgi:hypothetical protein
VFHDRKSTVTGREHDPSHGVPLDSRHDLANLGSIAENRDDSDGGSRCQLALAILADFLGNTPRGSDFTARSRCSIVAQTPVGRVWLMTESDVAEALAIAESNSGLLWDEKRGLYIERDSPEWPSRNKVQGHQVPQISVIRRWLTRTKVNSALKSSASSGDWKYPFSVIVLTTRSIS